MVRPHDLVISLSDLVKDDIHLVGEKALVSKDGFAITHHAYFKFLRDNNLEIKIRHLLGTINFDRSESITQISQYIKNLMVSSKIPDSIAYRVFGHYQDLKSSKVLVRISIVSGDSGQKSSLEEGVDEVSGDAVLLDTMRSLWARLFQPALIVYRNKNNLDHLKTGIAVVIQKA